MDYDISRPRLTPEQIAANAESDRKGLAERVRASEARREAEARDRLETAISALVAPAQRQFLADGGAADAWPELEARLLARWREERAWAAMMGDGPGDEHVRQLRESDPTYQARL